MLRPMLQALQRLSRGRRWRFSAITALVLGACASPPPRAPVTEFKTVPVSAEPLKARVLAAPDAREAQVVQVLPDGTRYLLIAGMRLEERPDGSLHQAEERLAIEGVNVTELPPRFNGGYLFRVNRQSQTSLWRAASFAGSLQPLVTLPGHFTELSVGLDRLYLSSSSSPLIGVDAFSGELLDLGPLPASPAYSSLAFADAWMGAVEVPLRGVLATFDAGESWHPIPDASGLAFVDGEVVFRGKSGKLALDPSGVREASQRRADLEAAYKAGIPPPNSAAAERARGFGRLPLREAVLRGMPGPKGSAYVVSAGDLLQVRLADAVVLRRRQNVVSPHAVCQGLQLSGSVGFSCQLEDRGTTVFHLTAGFDLKELAHFAVQRIVDDGGVPGVIVHGACDEAVQPERGRYCLLAEGVRRDLVIPDADGTERVVWHQAKTALVLRPPTLERSGQLVRATLGGKVSRVALRLPRSTKPAGLLKSGTWLRGFEWHEDQMVGWVADNETLVGVAIDENGNVSTGEPMLDVARLLVSGRFALLLTQDHSGWETIDAGATWHRAQVPAFQGQDTEDGSERGCSAVGCAYGPWLRPGWLGKAEKAQDLKDPELRVPPSPGGGAWGLSCTPTTEASPPPLAVAAEDRQRRVQVMRRGVEEAWIPFNEQPAPHKPADYLGIARTSLGHQAFAYAWGPETADWRKDGRVLLRVVDRFAAQGGLWSTLASPSPWRDAEGAVLALGHRVVGEWGIEIEPSGRSALVASFVPGAARLFIAEPERALREVFPAPAGRLAGAVQVQGSWYFARVFDSGVLTIYLVRGVSVESLASFVLELDEARGGARARLVRSRDAAGLGVLLSGVARHVYPLDMESLTPQAPWVVPASELARLPTPCGPGAAGYVTEEELSIAPRIELDHPESTPPLRPVVAKLVLAPGGVCVERLAAVAREKLETATILSPPNAGGAIVPLIISEQGTSSRRRRFDCKNLFDAPGSGRLDIQ